MKPEFGTFEHRAAIVGAAIILSILVPILLAAFYDADYGKTAQPVWLARAIGKNCTLSAYYPVQMEIWCRVYP